MQRIWYSIKRHIEDVVARRAKNSKAILLTGPRQVGKSTLYKHLFNNVAQVTFDDDLLLAQAEEDMASGFDVLDGVPDKKMGMGTIICLYDKKMYLRENLIVLPLEYI